ncbi:hypothetical protein A3768_1354 [Ralstonia solanacearum]|nr:hypothetical protein A3768_1354 [Ralstonia solanacearum]
MGRHRLLGHGDLASPPACPLRTASGALRRDVRVMEKF